MKLYVSLFILFVSKSNYFLVIVIVNYIYKQIHIEKYFWKILYSFIETHFLTNENPYGRSLSLRRHTFSDGFNQVIKINNYIFYDTFILDTFNYHILYYSKLIIVHPITTVLIVNMASKRMNNSCALL